MDATTIRDRFIEQITTLENLQDDIFNSIGELASPAYYNSNLPSFTKRNFERGANIGSERGANIGSERGANIGEKDNLSLNTSNRILQLKIVVEKCKNILGKFRESIETRESLQPTNYQNMLSIIDGARNNSSTSVTFPIILPPSIAPMEEYLSRGINLGEAKPITPNKLNEDYKGGHGGMSSALYAPNKIITGRLESAINVFRAIIKNTRETAKNQFAIAESVCDTQQVMIESLLRMFYRDVYSISVTLKHFYDNKLAKDMVKFGKYTEHQKELALTHQLECHKEMLKSLKSQHILFRDMMECLADEVDISETNISGISSKEKARLKKKIDELYKKNQKFLIESQVYYEAARTVVLLQPVSPVFYKAIRKWLQEYQILLIEILSLMILSNKDSKDIRDLKDSKDIRDLKDSKDIRDLKDSKDIRDLKDSKDIRDLKDSKDIRDLKDSKDIRDLKDSKDIRDLKDSKDSRNVKDYKDHNKENIQKSALYNYAKRVDPSRLIDLAGASRCIYPTTESVNEILLGFASFHLNNNKQGLTYLQKNIENLKTDYETLKKNVTTMVQLQHQYYVSSGNKLPDVRDYSKVRETKVPLSGLSEAKTIGTLSEAKSSLPILKPNSLSAQGLGTLNAQASGTLNAESSSVAPEVIKQLLKLNRELKISDARLQQMYHNLFAMGEDYMKMEQQNKKLIEIVEYLKQYSNLMREWEEKIKQEHLFVQRWNDVRKYNSRYMSMQFMEWNQFVTEQIDVFHQTITIYSTNLFHKIKELANDFMTQVLSITNKRNAELEGEINLITNLYNDIRNEESLQAQMPHLSDDLVRIQGQFEHWAADISYLYQVYFEHRLQTVVLYYLGALESLLDRFSETSELGLLLYTLDTMYDNSVEAAEEEKETRKTRFLLKAIR